MAFAIERGMCLQGGCDCERYQRASDQRGGPCENCGHYPAVHRNLSKPLLHVCDETKASPHAPPLRELDRTKNWEEQMGTSSAHQMHPLLIKATTDTPPLLPQPESIETVKKVQWTVDSDPVHSSFRNVLQSLPRKDEESPSRSLKKWAVKYRQSIELRAPPVFGWPLDEVMARTDQKCAVPTFMVQIVEYLTQHGRHTSGGKERSGADGKGSVGSSGLVSVIRTQG